MVGGVKTQSDKSTFSFIYHMIIVGGESKPKVINQKNPQKVQKFATKYAVFEKKCTFLCKKSHFS
jgi:hypothetical protein